MKFRLALFTSGLLLVVLGTAMLIPCYIDHANNHPNASAFFASACLCLFFGGALFLTNRDTQESFNVREGFLLTTISWLLLSLAGALPLYLSDLDLSFTDSYFESISGITTTGSTVLSGLDSMSRGVLLWRSMLQWIGGIGIVAFGIVLLPFLKIGGMQLFQTESSDRSDKIIPQSRQLVRRLVFVYVMLSFACFLMYFLFGMTAFDALNHAMTTLSTGGYSTHDASFGYFQNSSLQLIATFFMFLGGLPFVLYVKYMFLGQFAFHKDAQVVGFIAIIGIFTFLIVAWLAYHHEASISHGLVLAVFNVVSVLTTTGYATTDYTLWGPFITSLFFFMTYMGACTGSTAGGVKTMRILIVLQATRRQIKQLIYPHGLFIPHYQGRAIDNNLITTVMGFLALYVVLNALLTIMLTWVGLDPETAFSGAATAIANVGPGIGKTIGPAGNFSTLPDSAKWILSAGMFLGRLEILTVLVIFVPRFWRT